MRMSRNSAPMMVPTMMATFWLLLSPGDGVVALEDVDEDSDVDVDAGIGAVVGGEGEDIEVEEEVRDVGTVVVEDKVGSDERILDVGEPVVGFATAPDAADPSLEFVSLHTMGFSP